MSRIAIIGGHGKVALHLSRILSGEGHDVTSFIRNPEHVADVTATGASAEVLDVENSTTAELAKRSGAMTPLSGPPGPVGETLRARTPWIGMLPSAPWMLPLKPASSAT